MTVHFLVLLLVNACLTEYIFKPGPLIPASKGEIWPEPQFEDKLDAGFFSLLPIFFQFRVTTPGNSCKTLEDALQRYRHIIVFNNRKIKQVFYKASTCHENSNPNYLGYLTRLDVELRSSCNDSELPSIDMKEQYVLNITSSVQELSSDTVWGVLRGLESFSQLIYLSDDGACHRVETTSIRDFPRFPHRGLLLDTSRHYQTKESILKTLDAMSYNKLNVFHWHITDDYSFPYVSTTFPELSQKGAFHPTLFVYDQQFVAEVQEYARQRGIRVLVEFDTPGHTLSWGLGNPELLTQCKNVFQLEWGPINPIKNSTYDFIYKFYDEVKRVFKDEYTHLGGDEVDFACWKSNDDITQFMEDHDIADYAALQSYYTQKLIDYVTSRGLKSIVWEEVFSNGVQLPTTTAVQVWIADDPQTVLAKVTEAGHPAIVSSFWYLDKLQTGGDWLKFYNQDPQNFNGTDAQKTLVLGGEAAMWSEVVNEDNLEPRVWPRASAAAEKFWSAPKEFIPLALESIRPLAARLEEQTCRMNRRGIRAQPPNGPSICF